MGRLEMFTESIEKPSAADAVAKALEGPLVELLRQALGEHLPISLTIQIAPCRQPGDAIPLRQIERTILEASPDDGNPVTVKRLARLAGYSYSSYFRETVRSMIDRGLLVRLTNGVRKAR